MGIWVLAHNGQDAAIFRLRVLQVVSEIVQNTGEQPGENEEVVLIALGNPL